MIIHSIDEGQHKEVGWVRAPAWAVLIPRFDHNHEQVGWKGFITRDGAQSWNHKDADLYASFLGSVWGVALVVEFHTPTWAGLLDGSLNAEEANAAVYRAPR